MVMSVDVLPDVAERGGWLGRATDCEAAGWSLHCMVNKSPKPRQLDSLRRLEGHTQV